MAKRSTKDPFVVKQETFVGQYGAAMLRLGEGKLREWLVEEFLGEDRKIDRIIDEFGFTSAARNSLLAVPLALNSCLSIEAKKSPQARQEARRTTRKLNQLKVSLKKASTKIEKTSSVLPAELRVSLSEPAVLPNGDLEYEELGPGPATVLQQSILDFVDRIDAIGQVRFAPDYVFWAQQTLLAVANHYGVNLSRQRMSHLADALIGEARRRHGHQSRAALADRGDIPRHRDLVARAAPGRSGSSKTRRARPKRGSRKTGPKSG